MQIIKDFSGKLNMDVSPFRMPQQDYQYALNISRSSEYYNLDGPITNVMGNVISASGYTQPPGVNMCIGAKADSLRSRIIFFNYNSQGYHSILSWSTGGVITRIFQSRTESNDIDILQFGNSGKITDIDIVHRDEEGDLLLWNNKYSYPGQININDFSAGLYGTSVTDDLIRLGRIPGLDELNPAYVDDPNQLVNNLKKKLFQFTYAWVYKNGEISTVAPISKVALPYLAGEVSTESDPGKNNVITLQVVGGPQDYKSIRIFARENIENAWGDWMIVDTLDREDYGIDPGNTYVYRFLNDGQYVTADQRYMDLIFDYCADRCNAQAIVNGNVVVQAGITEGYDPIKRDNVNVQINSDLVDTDSSDIDPSNPTITYSSVTAFPFKRTDFIIGPSISEGCFYSIKFHVPIFDGPDYDPSATHIVGSSGTDADKISAAAQDLATQLNSQMNPNSTRKAEYVAPNIIRVTTVSYAIDSIITDARSPVFFTGGSATWKWAAKYRLGLVYVDKYGKTNGVISFVTSEDDPTDFAFTTPSFDFNTTSGAPKIPVVNASINHAPPSWAVAYYWVRTPNQTTDSFLQYVTAEVINDDVNYWYFCIENLNIFKTETTGFVPSYTFKSGDRLRVYASYDSSTEMYVNYPVADYEILGTVQREMTTIETEKTLGTYLKVKKPQGASGFDNNSFIEIYSPLLRTTDQTTVFYAFGESYPIYTDNLTGIKYHVGQIDNQTGSQPATFQFRDGDVYFKFREIYKLANTGKIDPTTVYPIGLMDANYSDYWNSQVNSNSRGWVIDPNAKRLYQPTLIRFSQAYQPGTDINGINRFYAEDFDEYRRDMGAVQRLVPRDNQLLVFQRFKVGAVPVDQQLTYNVDGSSNLILSSRLLNKIQYYNWEGGIGDCVESLALKNNSVYWWDNVRGTCNRLSQNGITPISITSAMNSFAVRESQIRGPGLGKIYGVFDSCNNLYISAFSEEGTSPAKTLVWNENRNGFESFVSYTPEMMCCINNLLVTFKGGNPYTHNSGGFNNFYGVNYPSSIKVVFGDSILNKKSWQSIMQQGNYIWSVPYIETSSNSVNQTKQVSNLIETDFDEKEDFFNASLLRDGNSIGGVVDGGALKGAYLIANFQRDSANNLLILNAVTAEVNDSPLNSK